MNSLLGMNENSEQNKPNSKDHLLDDATKHHQAGRLIEAERLYCMVLDAVPGQISALYKLGILYIQSGKPEFALPLFENALKKQPYNPGILNSLGVALQALDRGQEAAIYFRQALTINPSDIGALSNLGKVLREQNDIESALECFAKALAAWPGNPDLYIESGRCYYEKGNFQEALAYFEKALDLKPNYVDALSALATAMWALGRRTDARRKLELALQVDPHNPKLILNLGEFLYDEDKIDEALACFNKTLFLAPGYDNAVGRKSFALLAKGEYSEGWKLHAACLGRRDTRGPNIFSPLNPWDGTPGSGKHLMIWCEQGLGDSMQFIRYAELCKQQVGKVSVFCQKPLVRLFKALPFIYDASDVCDRSSFDEHVPIMNLPHIFGTVLETIPAVIPY
jgi:tetratricopeptide (TPR) repeat protein